jgi:hypothetical protein
VAINSKGCFHNELSDLSKLSLVYPSGFEQDKYWLYPDQRKTWGDIQVKYTSSGGDEHFCDRMFITGEHYMRLTDESGITSHERDSVTATSVYIKKNRAEYKGQAYSYSSFPLSKQLKIYLNGFWNSSTRTIYNSFVENIQ